MKEIPLSLFNLSERFLFLQLIIKILEKKLSELPALQPIYDRLMALRDKLEQAIFKEKGNSFTTILKQQDEEQKNAFLCFRFSVTAKKHTIKDKSLRPKANLIESIIRRHGWSLFAFGYNRQLTVSRSLITELKEPENLQIITDLELTAELDEWCGAVDEFEKIFTHKVENSATNNGQTASELGKETISFLWKVLPGWSYQSEFDGNKAYKEIMDAIQEGAAAIETQARSRATRRANKKLVEVD
ncbi:hypothetical protein DMA11_05110 [Marinilabiliaceae bacterium JC017]|nr:hypothetical protein DMA11_05110 [Marinilabiliaceae bacterium JC017]